MRQSRPIAHILLHIAYFMYEDITEVICHINYTCIIYIVLLIVFNLRVVYK